MKKNLKFYFAYRGILKNSRPLAMARIIIPIINSLPNKVKNNSTFFVGAINNSEYSFKIRNVHHTYHFFQRLLTLLNRLVFKLPSYKIYYFIERLYDYFLLLRIKEPVVLISTAYLYKASLKNKKIGGINMFLAGNPDDFEIFNVLKIEQQKYNVNFVDAYLYKKRSDYGLKSLDIFDHIFTLNAIQKESFVKRLPNEKVTCLNVDIIPETERFEIINIQKNENLTFCFVAHPFWLKGLLDLLEAWSKSNRENCLLKIGGRIDDNLQHIIDLKYASLKNVEYIGWVNDLNLFFRSSHVCIVPSLLDAGPQTIAEAMYCGLPVIITDGCGSRSLVKEAVNGFVVPSGNSSAISEKIQWFEGNIDKIELMGVEATKTIALLAKTDQNSSAAEIIIKVAEKLQKK